MKKDPLQEIVVRHEKYGKFVETLFTDILDLVIEAQANSIHTDKLAAVNPSLRVSGDLSRQEISYKEDNISYSIVIENGYVPEQEGIERTTCSITNGSLIGSKHVLRFEKDDGSGRRCLVDTLEIAHTSKDSFAQALAVPTESLRFHKRWPVDLVPDKPILEQMDLAHMQLRHAHELIKRATSISLR